MEQAMQREIRYIPPNPLLDRTGKPRLKKLRVAAYCRVSTDDEEQLTSYNAQKEYYTRKIEENPNWTLARIYADEGITGTSLKKRDEFNRMIAACKRGSIDLILTKSVSRFARNTIDCLDTIRMLRGRGIPVYFEKEGIDTMKETSEFLITLFSSFAQAESESISQNVKLGVRMGMKQGKVNFQYAKLLGYEKGEDGKPKIVPEEAKTVLRIYKSYLAGMSLGQIKTELEKEGIPTSSGVQGWSYQVIRNILTNEKYIGDALLQKTYITDCISKVTKKNNGELPQYYVEGNHPAIVSKELYHRVQEEMARRANKRSPGSKKGKTGYGKYSGKYALSERLICGECGTPYKRCTWARNGTKRIVWRCISRLEFGKKYCKSSPTMEEGKLHEAILRAMNKLVTDREAAIRMVKQALTAVIGGGGDETSKAMAIQKRLDELELIQSDLIQLTVNSDAAADYFDDKFKEVHEEKQALKEQLRELEQHMIISANANARLEELFRVLEEMPSDLMEYDDALTRQTVERITVVDAQTIRIRFYGMGIEVVERIGEDEEPSR